MDMPKILVVDDEEDLCEILKFNLEIEGYEVDTAFSAEEALKMDIASYQLLLLKYPDSRWPASSRKKKRRPISPSSS